MRHILTFKTSLKERSQYDHPKGYSACSFICDELAKHGIKTHPIENYRDIAWSVDCEIDSKTVFFFVGYLGTKYTDWQLVICSGTGLFKRLLGYKDKPQRIELARSIHSILSNDNRFSDLKWFSRYTDSPKDNSFPVPFAT